MNYCNKLNAGLRAGRRFAIASLVLGALSLSAASLTSSNSGTGAITVNTGFTWVTNNGGNLTPASTGWTGFLASDPDDLVLGPTTYNLVIANPLPMGAILNGALLDAAVTQALQNASPQWTRTTNTIGSGSASPGAANFNVTFGNTFTGTLVSISSGAALIPITPGITTLTGLDLYADTAFRAAIQAGQAVTVTWTQGLTLTGASTGYSGSGGSPTRCRGCTKVYTVTQVLNANSNAILKIGYTMPGAVPEPASAALLALGLGLLAAARRTTWGSRSRPDQE